MKTNQMTFNVSGMSCKHCEASIHDALGEIIGVRSVDVSLANKSVEVICSMDITPTQIIEAIEAQGFDASTK